CAACSTGNMQASSSPARAIAILYCAKQTKRGARRRFSSIPLTRVTQDSHNSLIWAHSFRDAQRGMHVRARRWTDVSAFLARKPRRHPFSFDVRDRDHLVDLRAVQDLGDEAGPEPLDRVQPGLTAAQHRARLRLDRIDLERQPARAQ